jgi:hypothetical protein
MVNSQPYRLRIHGTFVQDAVTRAAYLWNSYFGGYQLNLRLGGVVEMVDTIGEHLRRVGRQTSRKVEIDAIDLAGHAYPGGWELGCDLADAEQPTGSAEAMRWARLGELRQYWSEPNEGLTLRMCEIAQGERGCHFLAALARTVGARVRGWTGCYEIRATGYEYTAIPSGLVMRTGNTGRHWQLTFRHQAHRHKLAWAPLNGLEWVGRIVNLW